MSDKTQWSVEGLEACEPDMLPVREADENGIRCYITGKMTTSSGCDIVTVTGPTRAAVLDFVDEQWGMTDIDWFRDYIVGRVEEFTPGDGVHTPRLTYYTLVTFPARSDGNRREQILLNEEGDDALRFDSFDKASEAAAFMLTGGESDFPLIGICEGGLLDDGEYTGWSAGWVLRDESGATSTFDGDYENEPDWDNLIASSR